MKQLKGIVLDDTETPVREFTPLADARDYERAVSRRQEIITRFGRVSLRMEQSWYAEFLSLHAAINEYEMRPLLIPKPEPIVTQHQWVRHVCQRCGVKRVRHNQPSRGYRYHFGEPYGFERPNCISQPQQ